MSSLVKKMIMAITGLILFGFVVAHMLGNLQIFLGSEVLNSYAEHLEELGPLLWAVRIILLIALTFHIATAIQLAVENRAARPIPYASKNTVQASYASRTMVVTGFIVLAFIVYHLLHFTFGRIYPEFSGALDSHGRQDIYLMVVKSFQDPWVSGSYILAMFLLCVHLSHGLSSLFQSLGVSNEKWDKRFKLFAKVVATAIFIGNTSIPTAALLGILK